MPPRHHFVILFQGRTGSTFLVNALKNHPELMVFGELLSKSLRPGSGGSVLSKLKRNLRVRAYGAAKVQQHVAERAFAKANGDVGAGFKTKLVDLADPQAFRVFLESRGVATICMFRKNLVKQAVSHIRAALLHERTGKWNLFTEGDRLAAIIISPDELESMLQKVDAEHTSLREYANSLETEKMSIDYSDLLRNQERVLNRCQEFLGVEVMELSSPVRKNTPDNLRSALANYDEIERYFRDSKYEPMLREVER